MILDQLESGNMIERLISEQVFGQQVQEIPSERWATADHYRKHILYEYYDQKVERWFDLPQYSREMDAAFYVVDKMIARGYQLMLESPRARTAYWLAFFTLEDINKPSYGAMAPDQPALVICRAALIAIAKYADEKGVPAA